MGQSLIEILDWDSAFFKFPIARVNREILTIDHIQQINSFCIQNNVKCIYFLSKIDDEETIKLAERNGFNLVGIPITFNRNICDWEKSPKGIKSLDVEIRDARLDDINTLEEIARVSYYDSRFFFDSNFPRTLSESLFTTWIKVSFEGYADAVLVAEYENKPVGYITCHIEDLSNSGKIGLIAVSKAMQGHGIGKKLIQTSLDWFSSQGLSQVFVITQGQNIPASQLYISCGFSLQNIKLWYHKWY